MGSCNCVSNQDDQVSIGLYEQPQKLNEENIEPTFSEILILNSSGLVQALIRGYLVRRKFKYSLSISAVKSLKAATNELIDVRNYLPQSIIDILNCIPSAEIQIAAEAKKLDDGSIYIGE